MSIKINKKTYDKVLFIHVPKTAGRSVLDALQGTHLLDWKNETIPMHDSYPAAVNKFVVSQKLDIDSVFTFSVVRNPFTRMYSYYHHYMKETNSKISFERFIIDVVIDSHTNQRATPLIHYRQTDILADKNGDLSLNKIYKFENLKELEKDFKFSLPKLNVGEYTNDQFEEDFNENCISIIKDYYKADFESFDYSFKFGA
jgi:hypothetical protein